LLWIVVGAISIALVGFAALWLWGSWAFSPKGESHLRRLAEGAFPDGVTYEITSEGPTLGPARHCVNLGTRESGRSFCAVLVEAGGPRPLAVRRIDATRVEVEFEAPLADGARAVAAVLAEDRIPVEAIVIDPHGALRRQALY
jgi:hypothetical protein